MWKSNFGPLDGVQMTKVNNLTHCCDFHTEYNANKKAAAKADVAAPAADAPKKKKRRHSEDAGEKKKRKKKSKKADKA